MIWGLVAFAVFAGVSVGFVGGVLFSRWDQGKGYQLITDTVDKITTAALFPGLKGVVADDTPPVVPAMFDGADVDEQEGAMSRKPSWLDDEKSPAWNPYEEERV